MSDVKDDPEFGTAANADQVRSAVRGVRHLFFGDDEDDPPVDILSAAREADDATYLHEFLLSGRDLRVLRWALDRALESL